MRSKKIQIIKMVFMIILISGYFLFELIAGFETNSIALISDAYNMLSDLISVAIGLACLLLSKRDWNKSTYGWARAEVMGALVNSVFMIALCVSIFTGSTQRLVYSEPIRRPWLLLWVGIGGFAVNVLGLLILCGDAKKGIEDDDEEVDAEEYADECQNESFTELQGHCEEAKEELPAVDLVSHEVLDFADVEVVKHKSGSAMNFQGILLHLMGDALGSLVVVVSAVVALFADFEGVDRVDPVLSIFMVIVILCSTIPLFKQSAKVLLQSLPGKMKVSHLTSDLCSQIQGLKDVHDLHVWQLVGNRLVASLHLSCTDVGEYERLSGQLRTFFHSKGIFSTTFQPEFRNKKVPERKDYFGSCSLDSKKGSKKSIVSKSSSPSIISPPQLRYSVSTPHIRNGLTGYGGGLHTLTHLQSAV